MRGKRSRGRVGEKRLEVTWVESSQVGKYTGLGWYTGCFPFQAGRMGADRSE